VADKGPEAFRTISEVAEEIGVPQHVLRFWETRFAAVRPLKRGGNRRYYRPDDVSLLKAINRLLYTEGYTIKGVQKLLRDKGVKAVTAGGPTTAAVPEIGGEATLFGGHAADPLAATKRTEPDAAFLASLRSVRDSLARALAEAQAA
jgi:DNA-binding transcriptional MerR regulator